MNPISIQAVSWERMIGAVEKVRQRLLRTAKALNQAGVPYALGGGNAIAAWVSRIDESAVRNTQDVDILLRRDDLDTATRALEAVGFVRRHSAGMEMFLDGTSAKPRDAVHVIIAGDVVRTDHLFEAPDVAESEPAAEFQLIHLDALVRMKLTANCDKDRTHLRDLLEVGLVDATWCRRLPPQLANRLQQLIDNPEG